MLTGTQQETVNDLIAHADENLVNLGDIARGVLNMQAQYLSYYVDSVDGYPVLTDGLTLVKGMSYHSYYIAADDVQEFVERVIRARS